MALLACRYRHDYSINRRGFPDILYMCVRTIVCGGTYQYIFPELTEPIPLEFQKDTHVTLNLHEDEDRLLIRYMNSFPKGYKGYAVKTAFRLCSSKFPLELARRLAYTQEVPSKDQKKRSSKTASQEASEAEKSERKHKNSKRPAKKSAKPGKD